MESTIARSSSRPTAITHATAPRLIVAAASIVVAFMLWTRLGYVPIWDGYEYAAAIQRAATAPFDWSNLRLAGHASHAYALIVVAAQTLAPGEYWPILATNAVLLVVAAVGFHRLAGIVFPAPEHATERALGTAAFVLQPPLLAAVVQPGLDLPLVPGFVWAAVFALERRWVAAAATGIALAFTKETGVLLYAAIVASLILHDPRVALGTPGRRVEAAKRLVILAVPGIVFAVYLAYRTYAARGEPAVWNAGTAMIGQSLLRQLLVPRIDRHVASYVAIMLVLNFAWVMTVVVAAGAVASVARAKASGGFVRQVAGWLHSPPGFVAILAALTAFTLTRFATFANARYLLVFAGPLLLLFVAALVALRFRPTARRVILACLVVLIGVSVERTIDPVSRTLFGTFPFGRTEMLRMTSISRECCGPGRDQLAYNLEFTTLAALSDDALAGMGAGDSTMVVVPDSTSWHTIPHLDPATGRRTAHVSGSIVPLVAEADSAPLFAAERRAAIYLALPNGPAARGLAELASAFVVGPERRLTRGPHALSVYRLEPRTGTP